jgi:hypothetical protein
MVEEQKEAPSSTLGAIAAISKANSGGHCGGGGAKRMQRV